MRADDMASAARWMGLEVHRLKLVGGALRSWGLEPEDVSDGERLEVLGVAGELKLLGLRSPGPWARVRGLIRKVGRAAPEATVLWWWSNGREWTLAFLDGREEEAVIRRLSTCVEAPDEVGLLGWRSLKEERVLAGPSGKKWRAHLRQVLDQEGVTRRFFEGFSEALEALKENLIQGPPGDEERHEVALTTLLRVVFLYFLQARGALDGDRRFMMRQWRQAREASSFYRQVMRPLFFGALNRPVSRRGEAARELGSLPFLNGGLFESSAVEEAWPEMDWPDGLWEEVLEGLFERHRFAVEWENEGELRCAVDPEMLGKVFEGLMYGGRRRRSGSFYTPRDVVREMVEETMGSWLEEATGLDEEAVRAVLAGHGQAVDAQARGRIRASMGEMAIIDPAVGTGAFLLEALRVIRRVLVGLDEAEGVQRTPGERYERMRRIVQDHLSGVDIQPTAVRLCELRIWLAMLAALPELPVREMPPLPNLSHRLRVGNALVEPADWARYRVDGRCFGGSSTGRWSAEAVARMRRMEEAYTRAHGEEKRALKKGLEDRRMAMEARLLEERLEEVQKRRVPLEKVEASRDLFGEERGLDDGQRRTLEGLREQERALEQALADLRQGRRRGVGLCFGAQFAPIMARGGFDMVITNPPWVRQGRIPREERGLYRARYESVRRGLWEGAEEMGVRAPFGVQMDMAGIFLERSMELLRGGGRLCALVPSKLLRSLYGSGVRSLLAAEEVEHVEDLSESGRALFDATTYPAVLRVRKGAKGGEKTREQRPTSVAVWRGEARRGFEAQVERLGFWERAPGEPWVMAPPEIDGLFGEMKRRSQPLGTVEALPICGGIKTGANDVFMVDEEWALTLPAAVRQRYLRPVVRGRDMEESSGESIIWTIDEAGEVEEALPPALEAYFEGHRQRLEGRSDYKGGPLWSLFRYRPQVDGPKVGWRDMAEQLEAVALSARAVPLNTVYYIAVDDEAQARALVALFHSEAMRAVAWALGERARGGWRRHFAWVMRLLPVPRRWLGLWETSPEEAAKPEVIRRCFGLAETQERVLRRWRLGDGGARRSEAA